MKTINANDKITLCDFKEEVCQDIQMLACDELRAGVPYEKIQNFLSDPDNYSFVFSKLSNHLRRDEKLSDLISKWVMTTLLEYAYSFIKNRSIERDMVSLFYEDRDKLNFYVFHFNTKTGESGDMKFLTLVEAVVEFEGTEPLDDDDRVELMYAPIEGDNYLVSAKMKNKTLDDIKEDLGI